MSSFWVLAFPCFKKRLSFHQGIEYHWPFLQMSAVITKSKPGFCSFVVPWKLS
jgi:hypothetical protein